jgi:threonine synthase
VSADPKITGAAGGVASLGACICRRCGAEYGAEASYRCPGCGGVLSYRPARPRSEPRGAGGEGIWAHAAALPPVPAESRISIGEGGTPLVASRLAERLGLASLGLKNDAVCPTGSFKDRPLAVAASVARTVGARGLVCASTGNAAASTAAYAARAGLPSVAIVPRGTPRGKLAAPLACGARVIEVDGNYSDALAATLLAARQLDWLNTTTTYVCPYTVEGLRSVAYELCAQMEGRVPDWIAIPVGSGPLLTGVLEGYEDLRAWDRVERLPRMLAVQPAGCAPIVRALVEGGVPVSPWEDPQTVASGLADPLVGYPDEGDITVASTLRSLGAGVVVGDEEILRWVRDLAAVDGVFAEPSSAIAVAGIAAARTAGTIAAGESAVACLTGIGLKDPYAAIPDGAPTAPPVAVADIPGLLAAEATR